MGNATSKVRTVSDWHIRHYAIWHSRTIPREAFYQFYQKCDNCIAANVDVDDRFLFFDICDNLNSRPTGNIFDQADI